MLTYTFSAREKFMLAVLAFVAVGVLWYQFVFVNIQNQVIDIDSQISALETERETIASRASLMAEMKQVVDTYEESGIEPVLIPNYDNTQNLMAYLYSVLGSSINYSMRWDSPTQDEDGSLHRDGTITFTTSSYESARSITEAISRGPYPCYIRAVSITDGTKTSQTGDVTTNVQVVFFEKAPKGTLESEEETGGNDLSAIHGWQDKV